MVPCICQTCIESTEPHFYRFQHLENLLSFGKPSVACEKPPYLDVNISSLIDDENSQPMSNKSPKSLIRDQIFISYSHQDRKMFDELKIWLKPLERNGKLKVWDDTKIKTGSLWHQEIEQALASAKVAILMVSPHFIDSDFIDKNELPPILNAARADGLTVFWIPISHSPYEDTDFEKYQAAYSPEVPLDTLETPMRNKAWKEIYQKLKSAFNP